MVLYEIHTIYDIHVLHDLRLRNPFPSHVCMGYGRGGDSIANNYYDHGQRPIVPIK